MKTTIEVDIDDVIMAQVLRDAIDMNWEFSKEPGMWVLHASMINVLSYYVTDGEFDLYCNAHPHYMKDLMQLGDVVKDNRLKKQQRKVKNVEIFNRGYAAGYDWGVKESESLRGIIRHDT
jgi:hypothetical protein